MKKDGNKIWKVVLWIAILLLVPGGILFALWYFGVFSKKNDSEKTGNGQTPEDSSNWNFGLDTTQIESIIDGMSYGSKWKARKAIDNGLRIYTGQGERGIEPAILGNALDWAYHIKYEGSSIYEDQVIPLIGQLGEQRALSRIAVKFAKNQK